MSPRADPLLLPSIHTRPAASAAAILRLRMYIPKFRTAIPNLRTAIPKHPTHNGDCTSIGTAPVGMVMGRVGYF